MSRSLKKRLGYDAVRLVCRTVALFFFQYRCLHRQRMPAEGAVLVCANHQSYFDPVIVGIAFNRRLNFLARKTLFRFRLFAWLISFLDAIPIDRDGISLAGFRESLRRLKRDEPLLVFPEGTRTHDGRVGSLSPGFIALARRGRATLLPVGIDGAYEAWKRTARWPRLNSIHMSVGKPIPASRVAELSDEQLLDELERGLLESCSEARRWRLRRGAPWVIVGSKCRIRRRRFTSGENTICLPPPRPKCDDIGPVV